MRFAGFWSHHSREKGMVRWWLHSPRSSVAHLELSCPSHSWCSVGVTFGRDDEYGGLNGHVSLLRLGFYWGLAAGWARRLRHQEWAFAINDGRIRLECGANPWEWSRNQPWWWSMSVEPARVLFGKMQHSEREVSRTESVIPMPEGSYPCVVVMKDERWQRARLPWASHRIRRAHIDIPKGVPVPGKGENSWDCGDDATFSLCTPAKSVESGIAAVVESCLNTRRRYGGSVNWQATP